MTKLGKIAALLWCTAVAVAAGSAASQEVAPLEPAAGPDEPRRYTVEMIVFEYAGSANDSNERFLPDVTESPDIEESGDEPVFTDIPPRPGQGADVSKMSIDEIPLLRQLQMFLVEPDKYTMTDIYQKLQKLDAYRPIMHTAWTQTAVARELSPPVRLRRLGDAPLRLDGELTLYVSRFLHLVVDLTLDSGTAANPQSPDADLAAVRDPSGVLGDTFTDKPDLRPAPIRYRISEDRIFRNGDLRYFDHPKFGVLVKVTRYEPGPKDRDPAEAM